MSETASQELLLKVQDALKIKVSEFHFNNWFKLASWSLIKDGEALIEVPNNFVRDWILENYLELIKFEFFKLTSREFSVSFRTVSKDKASHPKATHSVVAALAPQKKETAPAPVTSSSEALRNQAPLRNRYTFDNFVVGNSNQFVYAGCRAVASNPAKSYNPFFIYGGVGLGKTHLLNSIAHEMQNNGHGLKVLFVTGEAFTNEVINCIRYDKTYELRKKYRVNCDVLLIDDFQFIAGKERTMEEFFHTFNTLYEARKQIVLTSDMLPKDIPHLEERLRSRCSWGLLADIQTPEFETRCAILRHKADQEKINLPNDVCQFIASHVKSNVRDLESCLVRVSAFASLAKVPLSVAFTNEVLRNILNGFEARPTIPAIQEKVANFFNLTTADLKSPRRHKNLALPRQIAMYLCRKHVKSSYPEIGHLFGGKDHTTVIHAVNKIEGVLVQDFALKEKMDKLEKIITQ